MHILHLNSPNSPKEKQNIKQNRKLSNFTKRFEQVPQRSISHSSQTSIRSNKEIVHKTSSEVETREGFVTKGQKRNTLKRRGEDRAGRACAWRLIRTTESKKGFGKLFYVLILLPPSYIYIKIFIYNNLKL